MIWHEITMIFSCWTSVLTIPLFSIHIDTPSQTNEKCTKMHAASEAEYQIAWLRVDPKPNIQFIPFHYCSECNFDNKNNRRHKMCARPFYQNDFFRSLSISLSFSPYLLIRKKHLVSSTVRLEESMEKNLLFKVLLFALNSMSLN